MKQRNEDRNCIVSLGHPFFMPSSLNSGHGSMATHPLSPLIFRGLGIREAVTLMVKLLRVATLCIHCQRLVRSIPGLPLFIPPSIGDDMGTIILVVESPLHRLKGSFICLSQRLELGEGA